MTQQDPITACAVLLIVMSLMVTILVFEIAQMHLLMPPALPLINPWRRKLFTFLALQIMHMLYQATEKSKLLKWTLWNIIHHMVISFDKWITRQVCPHPDVTHERATDKFGPLVQLNHHSDLVVVGHGE